MNQVERTGISYYKDSLGNLLSTHHRIGYNGYYYSEPIRWILIDNCGDLPKYNGLKFGSFKKSKKYLEFKKELKKWKKCNKTNPNLLSTEITNIIKKNKINKDIFKEKIRDEKEQVYLILNGGVKSNGVVN